MSRVIRVEIRADNLPVKLFAVKEGGLGDLKIVLRARVGYAPSGTIPSSTNTRFLQHRISVHASRNSTENINTIKRTGILEGGRKLRQMTFTQSLRTENLFVPLFVDVCSYLRPHKPPGKQKGRCVSLGSYHPHAFRLIYFVLVGKTGSNFDKENETTSRESFECRLFKLVILWTFLRLPSDQIGAMMNVGSESTEEYVGDDPKTRSEGGFPAGMSADEAVECFERIKAALREHLLNQFSSSLTIYPSETQFAHFTRSGLIDEKDLEAARTMAMDATDHSG
jgi:hypothetical protein